tara:strand:+ start:37113 stop:38282 length:1170 start_codon:yes stop_codon:yes gene_type:complete
MDEVIAGIDVYQVPLVQDVPYLGPLRKSETVNEHGYFVRAGNRTVYPRENRSIVICVRTNQGTEGWGETYGLVAPHAVASIIKDLLAGFVIGRNPLDVQVIHEDLYDLMRVRGYTGGFYLDALAAVDIALWDIAGKLSNQPLARLLGGLRRDRIPAYVSGLPEPTLTKRVDLALSWQSRGFDSFKFAAPVADDGVAAEIAELRLALGVRSRIACDMHWSQSRDEAVSLAKQMLPHQPWFIEAPVATEDIDGLAWVAARAGCAVAAGEEWRTVFDAKSRIDRQACQIIQPEMGHTGVTQFLRIANYAQAHHLSIMPHATIGAGIFLAASLQASAAIQNVIGHEFQHSILDAFGSLTDDSIKCESGFYHVPTSPGIGVVPSDEMRARMEPI